MVEFSSSFFTRPVCIQQHCLNCSWTSSRLSFVLAIHLFPLRGASQRHYHSLPQLQMRRKGYHCRHIAIIISSIGQCLKPIGCQDWSQLLFSLIWMDNRSNGIMLLPWRSGKLLVCNVTCPGTFAPSRLSSATSEADAVAALPGRAKHAREVLSP